MQQAAAPEAVRNAFPARMHPHVFTAWDGKDEDAGASVSRVRCIIRVRLATFEVIFAIGPDAFAMAIDVIAAFQVPIVVPWAFSSVSSFASRSNCKLDISASRIGCRIRDHFGDALDCVFMVLVPRI